MHGLDRYSRCVDDILVSDAVHRYRGLVDLSEPGRGLTSGLTMPILRVVAGRSTPVTAAQLTRIAGAGTEAGTRRALERLAMHGVCVSDEIGGRVVYSLNYDHVLYDAVAALLNADRELSRRLKGAIARWDPQPQSAVLYGSAARGDGDIDSDIDLFLVRPILSGVRKRDWVRQAQELRRAVHDWTGNRLQILDWTRPILLRHARAGEPLVDALLEDGVVIHGARLPELLERPA
jgi:predicted nucleotidyltransferase